MKQKSRGLVVSAGIVAAVVLSLLVMLTVVNRRDQSRGLNEEIQYDDFAFSVLGVRSAPAIGKGDGATRARGEFRIVTLKVANHAVRVDYRFKRSSPVLVDDSGREYVASPEGQAALEATLDSDAPCAAPIPAGSSCVTDVVFDLPADARVSHLRMSFGGPLGDLLDAVFWGRKRIKLQSFATEEKTSMQQGRIRGDQQK